MSLENDLLKLESDGLLRKLRPVNSTGPLISRGGNLLLNFSSNDYLGLANHPDLMKAAALASQKYGTGATASRLMSGDLEIHEELEAALAQICATPEALLFGSGFLANVGVLRSLVGRSDVIYADKLNHASLIDGMRLSEAKTERYRHCDMNHLEDLLKKPGIQGQKLIVSDSVFSMDGDIAPLRELRMLASHYNALLVIDEAHAVGIFGQGGGLCREWGLTADLLQGTLSKAFGSYGGFSACSKPMKQWLVNHARSFIYSTGLPAGVAAASLSGAHWIKQNPDAGSLLIKKAKNFRLKLVQSGFEIPDHGTQILPILIGDNHKTLEFSAALENQGLLATAIRPPTVPIGTSRIRLSICLSHSSEQLDQAAEILVRTAKSCGVLS
jgi:8-amino-7-oxononanoate synthase